MNVYLFEIILATGLLFLFATVLGTMREAVILRGDVAALAQLITKPPLPSYLGEVVPAAIAEEIGGRIGVSVQAVCRDDGAEAAVPARPG